MRPEERSNQPELRQQPPLFRDIQFPMRQLVKYETVVDGRLVKRLGRVSCRIVNFRRDPPQLEYDVTDETSGRIATYLNHWSLDPQSEIPPAPEAEDDEAN